MSAKLMSKIKGVDSLADRTHVNKFLEDDPLCRDKPKEGVDTLDKKVKEE